VGPTTSYGGWFRGFHDFFYQRYDRIKMQSIAYLVVNIVAPLKFNTATMCTVTHLPTFSAAFWFPILLFELFLFSLAFRVAWYNHKHLGNWRGASLLHIVLRDNFNYFFLCVVCPVSLREIVNSLK
jgi:hypothetical protein